MGHQYSAYVSICGTLQCIAAYVFICGTLYSTLLVSSSIGDYNSYYSAYVLIYGAFVISQHSAIGTVLFTVLKVFREKSSWLLLMWQFAIVPTCYILCFAAVQCIQFVGQQTSGTLASVQFVDIKRSVIVIISLVFLIEKVHALTKMQRQWILMVYLYVFCCPEEFFPFKM